MRYILPFMVLLHIPNTTMSNEPKKKDVDLSNPFTDEFQGSIADDLIKDGVSEEDALILNSVLTTSGERKGYMRLYHPATQKVLFKLMKKELIEELKKEKEEEDEEKAEAKKRGVQHAAQVARAIVEDYED